MRLMITGGGTAGHTSPAVAIIDEIRKRDPKLDLQWVGCRNSIEERICRDRSIPFRSVAVRGWPRGRSLRKLTAGSRLILGVGQSWALLRKFRPQAVIGVGGYVSLPVCWVAQRLQIPTFLHEQNRRLGLANRLLAPRATRLFSSFPDTLVEHPEGRVVVTGNPVRGGFIRPPDTGEACRSLGLAPSIPVLLIVGGSQGARSLNNAVAAALPEFHAGELQLIWMTGRAGFATARELAEKTRVKVLVFEFITEMATACAAADLLVCRGGASTTAEIAALGKPSILVPYPHATDDHQTENARALEAIGAAILLPDAECTGERLSSLVRSLINGPGRLCEMGAAARSLAKPLAAEHIVDEIFSSVFAEGAVLQEER